MRCFYLSTQLSKEHEVDLLALAQENLLVNSFGNYDHGINITRTKLKTYFRNVWFIKSKPVLSRASKILLAVKSLIGLPYSISLYRSPELGEKIRELAESGEYDLIHFDTTALAIYGQLDTKAPMVLDHHNIESHMMLRRAKKEANLFRKIYFYQEGKRLLTFEKRNLGIFSAHITCSELDSKRLKEILDNPKVIDIPNCVEVRQSLPRKPKEEFSLLFIGGMEWYPNLDAVWHFINDILPQLREANGISVDIIGRSPPPKLLEQVRELDNVKIHGYVDSLDTFYEKCDLFFCPIRDGGGTKLKVLDAMANRCAVIGYPEAFEGLDVKNNENALICQTATEFAELIKTAQARKIDVDTIGEKACDLVKAKYELNLVGNTLCNLYSRLALEGKQF